MSAKGVVEPVVVKEQAIKSAAESASMILRIDDVIASSKPRETPKMPSEGEGGEEY
jgi:chaperonin GroEL (HSP60 family)